MTDRAATVTNCFVDSVRNEVVLTVAISIPESAERNSFSLEISRFIECVVWYAVAGMIGDRQ